MSSISKPHIIQLIEDPAERDQAALKSELSKTMSGLLDVCRGIMADGVVTNQEVIFLSSWLQDAGFITEWPASEIAHSVERILEDGIVTEQEKTELAALLRNVVA
jgi:hypothetical protein